MKYEKETPEAKAKRLAKEAEAQAAFWSGVMPIASITTATNQINASVGYYPTTLTTTGVAINATPPIGNPTLFVDIAPAPWPAHTQYFTNLQPIVRIEPPRARMVFLRKKPTRLVFPYVVFIEMQAHQHVFVSEKMPTMTSRLSEFPLTWHTNENSPLIQNYSHIGQTGVVCYGNNAYSLGHERNVAGAGLFWGSNFSKYDDRFVGEWTNASKNKDDHKKALELALRRGLATSISDIIKMQCGIRVGIPLEAELALGETTVMIDTSDPYVKRVSALTQAAQAQGAASEVSVSKVLETYKQEMLKNV